MLTSITQLLKIGSNSMRTVGRRISRPTRQERKLYTQVCPIG
ncbi:hypothetical protein [Stygiolobus sp. RP850M]